MPRTLVLAAAAAVAILALALSHVRAQGSGSGDPANIVVLTDTNFDYEISLYPVVLTEFYASWCGWCQALQPEFYEAAAECYADPIMHAYMFGKIEVDNDPKTAARFGVTGHPIIKTFCNGQYLEDFWGDRTADAILTYMQSNPCKYVPPATQPGGAPPPPPPPVFGTTTTPPPITRAPGTPAGPFTRSYDHVVVASDFLSFYWSIEGSGVSKQISFAVAVNANAGWIALGVAMPGATMPGSDIGIAFVDPTGFSLSFNDFYAPGYITPVYDSCGPIDWVGVAAFRNNTLTVIEGWRTVEVRDPVHDNPIVQSNEPTHLIFAWGAGARLGYHDNATADLRLNVFVPVGQSPAPEDQLRQKPSLFLGISNYAVPPADSSVYSACVTLTSNMLPMYIAGFAAAYTSINATTYVLDIVVKGYRNSPACDTADTPLDLFAAGMDGDTWFAFPAGVGMDASRFKSFNVWVHYSNPGAVPGVVDSSGVRVYYTSAAPANLAGLIEFADPGVKTTPANLPAGTSLFSYECPSSCTNSWDHDITIFASMPHMHDHGTMLSTTYSTSAGTQYFSSGAEFFDYKKQRFFNFDSPVTVHRGDIVRTSCAYDTIDGTTTWGTYASSEQCVDYVYYYPVLTNNDVPDVKCGLGYCGSLASTRTLSSDSALNRTWGTRVCNYVAPTQPTTSGPPTSALPTNTTEMPTSTTEMPTYTTDSPTTATDAPIMPSTTAKATTSAPTHGTGTEPRPTGSCAGSMCATAVGCVCATTCMLDLCGNCIPMICW